jgi:galactose-1-phosphate uridylyltransferase|tara:strand:+ start:151 stop:348 length:198 start_codon:yes stop_codon:yes gene_type:complete
MPFKSDKQERWMWANKPEMAKKWSKKSKKVKEELDEEELEKVVREEIGRFLEEMEVHSDGSESIY